MPVEPRTPGKNGLQEFMAVEPQTPGKNTKITYVLSKINFWQNHLVS